MMSFNQPQIRYKCANCEFVFDYATESLRDEVKCPNCKSNACDKRGKNE